MPGAFTVITTPRSHLSKIGHIRRRMQTVLGLDRAISFTILARGWSSSAGLVTVVLIARFLSPAEQGYYYAFTSLIALQIVFELGFSFVILQMASHERAHLSISSDFTIAGDPAAHARLASVIQKSVRWYSIAAVLMAATLVPFGIYFFSAHGHIGGHVSWILPWCLVAIAATLTFQIDPILSFLEGCSYVADVAHIRLTQSITGSFLAWFSFVIHRGLFAPAMMLVGMVLAGMVGLIGKRQLLLGLLRQPLGPHQIRWKTEVWPFQWRIAVSWLCGYFLFQLFIPVLFVYRGAIAAGQMGMSLSMANAIQSVAVSWISTKSAPFGTLVARKDYSQLDHIFFRALKHAVIVCFICAALAWLGCVYINVQHLKFAQRLLRPMSLGILLLSVISNVVVIGEACYLRAHKEEKFLLNSIVGAVLVGASTFFLGKLYGAEGMVIGYCILNFVGLLWGTLVFRKYRRIWHAR
jgi:hypothetical protein